MKDFTMGLGEQKKLNAVSPPRKPLRTMKELASELGVAKQTLISTMNHHDGLVPKPKLKSPHNVWYDPDEVRSWWKDVQHIRAEKVKQKEARSTELARSTRAFLAQQWLREHGAATQLELVEAGFPNMSPLTIARMLAHGSITKEIRGRRAYYTATDIDYVTRRGFQGGKNDE